MTTDPRAAALRKIKAQCAARRRNLRDPKLYDTRVFPAKEDRTVAEYIKRYSELNYGLHLGVPFKFVNVNGEAFK